MKRFRRTTDVSPGRVPRVMPYRLFVKMVFWTVTPFRLGPFTARPRSLVLPRTVKPSNVTPAAEM